jgi:hypothetical protein
MFPPGEFNVDDLPTYVVQVPAPAAVLTYQFIVHQPDGTLVTSKRFTVQRPCIQTFRAAAPAEGSSDASSRREMAELVAQHKRLELEIKNLEAALVIVDDLKKSFPVSKEQQP